MWLNSWVTDKDLQQWTKQRQTQSCSCQWQHDRNIIIQFINRENTSKGLSAYAQCSAVHTCSPSTPSSPSSPSSPCSVEAESAVTSQLQDVLVQTFFSKRSASCRLSADLSHSPCRLRCCGNPADTNSRIFTAIIASIVVDALMYMNTVNTFSANVHSIRFVCPTCL